jgi:hypothetical protein
MAWPHLIMGWVCVVGIGVVAVLVLVSVPVVHRVAVVVRLVPVGLLGVRVGVAVGLHSGVSLLVVSVAAVTVAVGLGGVVLVVVIVHGPVGLQGGGGFASMKLFLSTFGSLPRIFTLSIESPRMLKKLVKKIGALFYFWF